MKQLCLAALGGLLTGMASGQDASAPGAAGAIAVTPVPLEEFDVLEYRVIGANKLDTRSVERAVYPHLGYGKTSDDVQQARAALELAYRTAGFGTVFVDVPEQDVVDGVVRLRVTEGRLDRVVVTGARYFSAGRIRESLPSVERGVVPHLPGLQQELNALNTQTRDRSVVPILKAGRTPGMVDLELRVQDELPLHGSIDVNDRYTADTSRTRVGAQISYDNLFQRRHSLSLQAQTAPEEPDESKVFAATYVMPWGETGRSLAFYAVDTDSDVAALGALSVLGKGRIYGARFIQPIAGDGGLFHNLTAGVDYKDFSENILLDDETGLSTPISYLQWSLAYQGGLRAENSSTQFSLSANFGSRRLWSSSQEFAERRFLGSPSYIYLRGNLGYERRLPWGFAASLRLAGQFAPRPLVPNEQFSIGGADSVRGYLESTNLGDYGFSGSFELHSPSLLRAFGENVPDLRLLTFFDAGVVRIQKPIRDLLGVPTQTVHHDLSSVGLGLRLQNWGGLEASVDYARALVPSDRIDEGDTRVHFGVRYGF